MRFFHRHKKHEMKKERRTHLLPHRKYHRQGRRVFEIDESTGDVIEVIFDALDDILLTMVDAGPLPDTYDYNGYLPDQIPDDCRVDTVTGEVHCDPEPSGGGGYEGSTGGYDSGGDSGGGGGGDSGGGGGD